MPIRLKCPICSKEFHTKPSRAKNRKYCSRECRGKAGQRIVAVICRQCGRQFEVTPYKASIRKYCSPECSAESKARSVTMTCQDCGKTFSVKPYEANKRKFCSHECAHNHKPKSRLPRAKKGQTLVCNECGKTYYRMRSRVAGSKLCSRRCGSIFHGRLRTRSEVQRTCTVCNKEFTITTDCRRATCSNECAKYAQRQAVARYHRLNPKSFWYKCDNCNKPIRRYKSRLSQHKTLFCSRQCLAEWLSHNIRGSNHPNWRGGSIQYKLYSGFKKQRRKALDRDRHTCQICGATRRKLHVHHVMSVRECTSNHKEPHKPNNLITLCYRCHPKVEFGKLPCPVPEVPIRQFRLII